MLWVRAINWSHGIRTQQGWTDVVRFGFHLILTGLPLAWLIFIGLQAPEWLGYEPWSIVVGTYLIVVFVLGLCFPLVWLEYASRMIPKAQQSISRRRYDIGKALGRIPRGQGRRGWMAHLPFNQAFEVELVERELLLPGLPDAWDGLRILHMSDLHFWGRPSRTYFDRLFHMCSAKCCDLFVVTGDLVDSPHHYEQLHLLNAIKPAEHTLVIRGNHDARYDADHVNDILHQLGFVVLGGSSRVLTVRGLPLLAAGNEAPWLLPVPDLKEYDQLDCFRLALIHSPDQFLWAVTNRFDLVLAGHNHGGQIRIPGFGSIFVPGKTGRRYDMGLHAAGSTLLHVSRGVSGGHPVRYFCRPEVTWLTLRSSKVTSPRDASG